MAEDRAGLKIGPYNHKLRSQLARHLLILRNWQEALAAADAVLELSPGDFTARVIRARCLAELGKGAEAKGVLDALQKDFPAQTKEIDDLRRNLGSLLPR